MFPDCLSIPATCYRTVLVHLITLFPPRHSFCHPTASHSDSNEAESAKLAGELLTAAGLSPVTVQKVRDGRQRGVCWRHNGMNGSMRGSMRSIRDSSGGGGIHTHGMGSN